MEGNKRRSLPERVAQLYYSHALFCSSHPVLVIVLSLACFLCCCYPLLNIPLPGSAPTRIVLPCSSCTAEKGVSLCWTLCVNSSSQGEQPFPPPLAYVHQLILNTGVWPWNDSLRAEDAYRVPLQEAFHLLDIIRNHQDPVSGMSLGHLCYHVESVSPREKRAPSQVFPEYSCLLLSPANLWQQDMHKFSQDPDPLETVFTHQSLQKGKISTAEMVFGMHLKETGLKRYPLRARTRVLQYAVTLFYTHLNVGYMRSLNQKLLSSYPESRPPSPSDTEATLIYYPNDFNYYEFVPLCLAFVGLFFYVYFSVRKIEFIESKVGLAVSAAVSIAAGLAMSIGICFFFGLTLSFRGKEIFPYLVILVGLENVFVLTKSVMSIDSQLDVKIRLAQGLSREGWSITKNILTEITILTMCLFTCIPVIQQFSIFMIVSLLCDFFLQMLFFTTVLGVDIRRKQMSRQPEAFQFYGLTRQECPHSTAYDFTPSLGSKTLPRSKSQPRLNGACPCPPFSSNSPPRPANIKAKTVDSSGHVPKRVRLVTVWARTRFFQRAFMVWMVVWVSMIVYSSSVVEDLLLMPQSAHCSDCSSVRTPPRHWAALLRHYNVTCAGRHLAVAPPLMLRHRVSPDIAMAARPSPPLPATPPLRWRAIAAALDPLDFSDLESEEGRWGSEQPYYPSSLMEVCLVALLCAISVVCISYMLYVLYRCVCTRNYAEWRAPHTTQHHHLPQMVMEMAPLVVAGHVQEVECLATDGERVVSCCLLGTLKVWDAHSGDLLTSINRTLFFELQHEVMSRLHSDSSHTTSEGEGTEQMVPQHSPKAPSLRVSPHFKFSGASGVQDTYLTSSISRKSKTIYDFTLQYRMMQSQSEDNAMTGGGGGMLGEVMEGEGGERGTREARGGTQDDTSAIWCLDLCRCRDVIVVGCANGRLEVWSASTGRLECAADGGAGVTHLRCIGETVALARLSGHVEVLRLQGPMVVMPTPQPNTRGHVRTGSAGSIPPLHHRWCEGAEEGLNCHRVAVVRAHQQPVSVMECDTRWLVTGSHDHTVKVYWLEELSPVYVFHGHHGPVGSLLLDGGCGVCVSGSQEGVLCVWELGSGACVYSVTAHHGAVTALSVTQSYVISLGEDHRMCIWDRFRGHLLNSLPLSGGGMSCGLLSLGPSLVVVGGRGGLTLWDVTTPQPIRKVHLGPLDSCTYVKQILPLGDGIVCDYSNQLRILKFPSVSPD